VVGKWYIPSQQVNR